MKKAKVVFDSKNIKLPCFKKGAAKKSFLVKTIIVKMSKLKTAIKHKADKEKSKDSEKYPG